MTDVGVSLSNLRAAGCQAATLRSEKFTARELKDAGYPAVELHDVGFTIGELFVVFAPNELQACVGPSGSIYAELAKAGVSAEDLWHNGVEAGSLKPAGYTATDLADAGYTCRELREASFSLQEIKHVGYDGNAMWDAGFSISELRAAGFEATAFRPRASAEELIDGGFDIESLRNAGIPISSISLSAMKKAGATALELRTQHGFKATDLLRAGYTLTELKQAGYPKPSDLKLKNEVDTELLVRAGLNADDHEVRKTKGNGLWGIRDWAFPSIELVNAGLKRRGGSDVPYICYQNKEKGEHHFKKQFCIHCGKMLKVERPRRRKPSSFMMPLPPTYAHVCTHTVTA